MYPILINPRFFFLTLFFLFLVSVLPDGGNLREGERRNNGDNGSPGMGVAEQNRLEGVEIARSEEQKRHVPEDRGSAAIVSKFLFKYSSLLCLTIFILQRFPSSFFHREVIILDD